MNSSGPLPLQDSQSIEIIFPTKSPLSKEHLAHCVKFLEEQSFHVICHDRNAFHENRCPYGYYAHTLDTRTQALIDALNGPAKILWAFVGGFGCVEIVERLESMNFLPPSTPKLLIGFSDITHLHALWAKWGWPSLHGPNIGWTEETRTAVNNPIINSETSLQPTLNYLCGREKSLSYTFQCLNAESFSARFLSVQAPIYGGNATLVKEMDATPTALPLKEKFLFLEESPECPKRMSRVFTSLWRSRAFESLAGLLFGYIPDPKDLLVPDALHVFLNSNRQKISFPILYNPNFGHGTKNDPLPFGVPSRLFLDHGQWRLDIPSNFGRTL